MSLCDLCGERPAVVSLQHEHGVEPREWLVCSQCALSGAAPGRERAPTVADLVSGLVQPAARHSGPTEGGGEPEAATRCATCGTTWAEIRDAGLVGCGDCYTTFADEVSKWLRELRGRPSTRRGWRHRGKLPRRLSAYQRVLFDLRELRSDLQAALAVEDYERAAGLRDRIAAIEQGDRSDSDERGALGAQGDQTDQS